MAKKIAFKVAITRDLQIGFFAENDTELTPAQARQVLDNLVAALGTDQLRLENAQPAEQHIDNARLQAVHDLTHAHNHNHRH